jgi:leader peptidase (prepilin peptidase)/N-methyltransferase
MPDFLPPSLIVVLGLVMGSFLNVVIARLPAGRSVVWPGSACPECGQAIRWFDNVPLVSWLLLLRGRCRACRKPISVRYPVVEFLTALLFYAMFRKIGWESRLFFRDLPFVSLAVAITFIDLDLRIIPDRLSLPGIVLGLGSSFFVGALGDSLAGAALGFLGFYGLSWGFYQLTGRVGLGGGDIKLLAMIGAFIGVQGVLTTILVSSILGTVIGLIWGLATRQGQLMRVSIPYGPFLLLGALADYFLRDLLWLPFMIPT